MTPPVPLSEVDVDPPPDIPDKCPNCGEVVDVDAIVPVDTDESVEYGDHRHFCHIGSAHNGPLSGWRVVHR